MTALADARRELRAAVDRVAGEYAAGDRGDQVGVDDDRWRAAEREIDAAFAAGDVPRARAAIVAWLRAELCGGRAP